MSTNEKLSTGSSWWFVLGTIAVAIATSYALAAAGLPMGAGIGAYFLITLVGALVTTRKTLATGGGTIGRFMLLQVVGSIVYYVLIQRAVGAAAAEMKDVDPQHAAAAGAAVGGFFGAIVAVLTFVVTGIGATIGALIGARKR